MLLKQESTPPFQAIILAAGRSSRFNTGITKLSYTLCGQEMIAYPLTILQSLQIPVTVVVGFQKEAVAAILTKHLFAGTIVEQEQQNGTGAAVALTKPYWHAQHILVMNGDMPLVTPEIISQLIEKHTNSAATVSFVTAYNADPSFTGYGRVMKDGNRYTIIESSDFTGDATQACYINAGIYLFKREFLEHYCDQLQPNNKKKEFYLTDLIACASTQNYTVETIVVPFDQIRGINTLKELWASEHIKRSELISYWMERGVHFSAAQTVHIDLDVTIGAGTRIESGVRILAGTRIGSNCYIDAGSVIKNSTLADAVLVKPYSVIQDSSIETHAEIGPFAHIRSHSVIGAQACIGNFVEVSKSTIAEKTKAKHLSYLGNALVGSEVNIGAGTIVCNYNGVTKKKSTTVIEDHALIGSNNSIVAPVKISAHAVTAAGSTITEDVPEYALALGRARQVNKENYRSPLIMSDFPQQNSKHD